jgi:hypothetical protein
VPYIKVIYYPQEDYNMTEREFRELLHEILVIEREEGNSLISNVQPFEGVLMTNNEGLIVRTKDGSEFQLTIVKSK